MQEAAEDLQLHRQTFRNVMKEQDGLHRGGLANAEQEAAIPLRVTGFKGRVCDVVFSPHKA